MRKLFSARKFFGFFHSKLFYFFFIVLMVSLSFRHESCRCASVYFIVWKQIVWTDFLITFHIAYKSLWKKGFQERIFPKKPKTTKEKKKKENGKMRGRKSSFSNWQWKLGVYYSVGWLLIVCILERVNVCIQFTTVCSTTPLNFNMQQKNMALLLH